MRSATAPLAPAQLDPVEHSRESARSNPAVSVIGIPPILDDERSTSQPAVTLTAHQNGFRKGRSFRSLTRRAEIGLEKGSRVTWSSVCGLNTGGLPREPRTNLPFPEPPTGAIP